MPNAAPDDRLALEGATCGLWWRHVTPRGGHRVGAIGELVARDLESTAELLALACARLAARDCSLAVGPMDGSTWHTYRAVLASSPRPRFSGEPFTHPWIADGFVAAGFTVAARYLSVIEEPLGTAGGGRPAARELPGIRVRPFDGARAECELARLHPLCLAAFRSNPYFTPIERDDFIQLYAPMARMLDPRLAWVAEDDREALGFLLAFPNLCDPADREAGPTVVLKTVAVHPACEGAGLARRLADTGLAAACAAGYRRVIHALMHESNRSAAWSARRGQAFRRYGLFARELTSF